MSSIKCDNKTVLSHDEYIQEKRSKPYNQRFKAKKVYKDSKDKENNKTERIQIRVSKKEKQEIIKLAYENNMKVSEYILNLIFERKNVKN